MNRHITHALSALALLISPLGAQGTTRSYGFVMLLGTDTIGVERVTVQDGRWSGDVTIRNQGRVLWVANVGARARFSELHLTAYRNATDTVPMQVASLTVAADTVRFRATVPSPQARPFASKPDAFLLLNSSVAMVELMARRVARGTTDTMPVFLAQGGQTIDATLAHHGDSALLTLGGQLTLIHLDANGGMRQGYNAAQNLRFVRVRGDSLAKLELGAPNYDPPPGAPYTAEHVRIPVPAGHELAATFTRPMGTRSNRLTAVVTISGSGSQNRDEYIPVAGGYRPFRQVADMLARRGVAVLRFDDRGYGGSTGNADIATSADFADDVRAAVAWLRARSDVDPERIVLLGHSEGGLIAPMVASSDSRLAGIVLMAGPSQNGRDIIYYQQRYALERDTSIKTAGARDSAIIAARAAFDSLARRRPWYRYFVSHDPIAVARTVKVPTLIVHGETDRQVTAEQAEELGAAIRAGGNRDVTVKVFPGLNHLFLPDPDGNPANYARISSGRIGDDVMQVLGDWIVARGTSTPQSARPAWADSLDALVRAELTRTNTPGAQLAVVAEGRLVYAAGYGIANVESGQPVTAETLFRVGSVTKMFTGAAIAQLASTGKLRLDAPIGSVVHELSGRVAQVTTHQLLTHSAGWIDNAVPYGRMGEAALGEVMREVTDTLFFTEPGRTMSYSNPGYSMAGYVAEVAAGQRFGSLVESTVLRPTGMERATFKPLVALTWPTAMGHVALANGTPAVVRPFTENAAQWAAGFLMASAPEIARFTMMLMNGGTIDGRTVLSADAVRSMTTGHVAAPGRPVEDSARYAYGLTVGKRGVHRIWQHGGSINGFDANVVMLPDRKFAFILLDNRSGAPLTGLTDAAMRYTIGVTPPASPSPPPPRDATPAERNALVGRYAMSRTTVEIAVENGALVFKQGTMTAPLRIAGSDAIVVSPPGGAAVRLNYALGPDGRVAYLYQSSRALARQN